MAKAQSSIEFIILIGVALFFFIALLGSININLAQKAREQRDLEVQELALDVQNEIRIASEATNGYQRNFEIPTTIINLDYEISLVVNSIYIITEDNRHAISLETQNVSGSIQKGTNTIRKINETVFLN